MRGQIIERGRNTWLVRIYRGRDSHTGKRRFLNKTIHGTKREAQKWVTAKLREIDTGTFVEPTKLTVAEYLKEWLDTVAQAKVQPQTLAQYRRLLRTHMVGENGIGDLRLSQLAYGDIQKIYNGMTASGLSPRTVRYAHTVFRSALKEAVRRGLIFKDPTEGAIIARQDRKEMKALSQHETMRFLEASRGDPWEALWTLLVTTGLRPGEAAGVKWSDFDEKSLTIRRSLIPGFAGTEGEKAPKTRGSSRRVILIPRTLRVLRAHRARQAADQLRAGSEYKDHDFIFAGPTGSPVDMRNLAKRNFRRILKKANLPVIRLYDLRHTAATLLMAGGMNPKLVADMLGHKSIKLTLDVYSHVQPGMQEDVAKMMGEIVSDMPQRAV